MVSTGDVELPDQGDNIIRTKDVDFNPNPKGLGHELLAKMKEHRGKIVQVDAESGETDTFDAFLQRCVRVALNLRKMGVTHEDIVSPCTSNHVNSAVAMTAPLLLGAKIACLDPFAVTFDIKSMINVVKPKLLLVSEEGVEKVERALEELNLESKIIVFGASEKHVSFDKLLAAFPGDEEENFVAYEVEDLFETAVIVFSSGSTGVPKGICLSHYVILCQLSSFLRGQSNSHFMGTKMTILFSTLVWVSGQVNVVMAIFSGNARLICSQFSAEKTWKYLAKYDIVSVGLPPHDAMTFLKYGKPDKIETPSLRLIIVAGGKISVASMRALQQLFLSPVLVMAPYGQSEVYGSIFSFSNIQKFIENPECVGQPSAGFWYKIVDPESGKVCGPHETGEICIKSKFVMNGYYKHDSSDRFDPDGFLRTGDMGYYDEEHCFFVVERLREALRFRMQWIPPTLLENILYEHPAVKVAVVIGIPSDDGDIATAVVVKSDTAGHVDEEELLNFVNGRVDDKKKIRGGVIFVEDSAIPYTPTGKIRRFLLKKNILGNLDKFNIKIDQMVLK